MWPPVFALHCWSMSLYPGAPWSVLLTRSSLVIENKKLITKKVYLKDHVTLKTGEMAAEKSALPSHEYIIF